MRELLSAVVVEVIGYLPAYSFLATLLRIFTSVVVGIKLSLS